MEEGKNLISLLIPILHHLPSSPPPSLSLHLLLRKAPRLLALEPFILILPQISDVLQCLLVFFFFFYIGWEIAFSH